MKAPRSPNPVGKLSRVQPTLEQLLPRAEQRLAFEEASAALEAGQLVRAARMNAGLTQVELAQRLGVEQPRVSAIEAGRGRDGPSYALLKRIFVACNIPWFIPDTVMGFMSPAEPAEVMFATEAAAVMLAEEAAEVALAEEEEEIAESPKAHPA